MIAESVWRRQGYSLVPWSAEARDAVLALPEGGQCAGNLWVPRYPQQLQQYWVLLRIVADAVGMIPSRMSDLLKLELGLYAPYVDPTGRVRIEFASISLGDMDAVDFNQFMGRAIVTMAEKVGAAPKDLRREFNAAIRKENR